MSLYWNDTYNPGTGLYALQDNTSSGDFYCADLFIDNSINDTNSTLIKVGDLTTQTEIGKVGGNTVIKSGLKINSITTDGFLRIDGTIVSANNQLSNISIVNPNIQSNINMRGFDIYNANIISSNNITSLSNAIANINANISGIVANANLYVLKTGSDMSGDLNIIGASLAVKYNNTPSN